MELGLSPCEIMVESRKDRLFFECILAMCVTVSVNKCHTSELSTKALAGNVSPIFS